MSIPKNYFYKKDNYISNDGFCLSLTIMHHYENLKLIYKHNNNEKSIKKYNRCFQIIPNILLCKIICTINIANTAWSVYAIDKNYIIVCNGEWVAEYKVSLHLPKYKSLVFNKNFISIYDSIYHMDKYQLVKVGNKWCDLCIDTKPTKTYELLGTIYCPSCIKGFKKFKKLLLYKYMFLNLFCINDITKLILHDIIALYNLYF